MNKIILYVNVFPISKQVSFEIQYNETDNCKIQNKLSKKRRLMTDKNANIISNK